MFRDKISVRKGNLVWFCFFPIFSVPKRMCKSSFSFLSFIIIYTFFFFWLLNFSLWRVMKEINGFRRSRMRYCQIRTATPTIIDFVRYLWFRVRNLDHIYTKLTKNIEWNSSDFCRFFAPDFRTKNRSWPTHHIFNILSKCESCARNTEIRIIQAVHWHSNPNHPGLLFWLIINQRWWRAFSKKMKIYERLWHFRFPSHPSPGGVQIINLSALHFHLLATQMPTPINILGIIDGSCMGTV